MIKLNTLYVKNFMCSQEAFLDFTDQRVILLTGDNGNGKSLVLEAIALCLLKKHKRGDSYADYIRRGTMPREAQVILTGELNGLPIKFDITIQESGLNKKVTYDKEKPYVGIEVNALLDRLGIGDYSDLIMSMQGKDGDIVDSTPGKRAEYLRKLLNYTYLYQSNFISEQLKSIKQQITRCNDIITLNTNTINIKKTQIRDVPEDTSTEKIQELNQAVSVIKNQLVQYMGLNEKQLEITNKLNKVLQEKYSITTAISNLENSINQLPSLKDTLNNYNSEISKLTESITSNLSNSSSLNNSLLIINSEITNLENKRSEVIADLATAKAELASIQKHISLINKGKCPECGHEFTSSDKDTYEKQLNEANQKIESLTATQNELFAKISSQKDLYSKTSSDVSNITNEVNLLNNKLSNIQQSKPKLEEQVSYLESAAVAELTQKKTELSSLESTEASIKLEQENLAKDLKVYETLNVDLRNAQQQINILSQQALNRNNIINQNNNILTEIQNLESASNEQISLVENLHRDEAVDKEVATLLDELRDYAVIKACDKLEAKLNSFVKIIFPTMFIRLYQNKSGVEFFYDTSGKPNLKKEDLSNAKMASGFEKAALSIAFKVAVCKAYKLPFAFFDEADEKGSEINSANLFRSLLNSNVFEQVFIISQKSIVRETIQNEIEGVRTYYVSKGNFSLDGDY